MADDEGEAKLREAERYERTEGERVQKELRMREEMREKVNPPLNRAQRREQAAKWRRIKRK